MKTIFNKVIATSAVILATTGLAQANTVDFTNNGTSTTPSFTKDAVTVTGSITTTPKDIQVLVGVGLGVVGEISDATLDPGETMSFSFDNQVEGVVIDTFTPADSTGDGLNIEATITGFDGSGNNLGSDTAFITSGVPIEISNILNVGDISSFDITMIEDGLIIGSVSFQDASSGAVPEYSCYGFGNPLITDDPSTSETEHLSMQSKNTRTIPVKTPIIDQYGYDISGEDIAGAEPVINVTFNSAAIDGGTSANNKSLLRAKDADSGNQLDFNSNSGDWEYNLGTKNLKASGTYEIEITSGDSELYTLNKSSCTIQFERETKQRGGNRQASSIYRNWNKIIKGRDWNKGSYKKHSNNANAEAPLSITYS